MSKVMLVASVALVGSAAMAGTAVAAAFAPNTVGVYDSTNNSNAVDRNAAGNAATFTASVLTAFNANRGGVVNFDGAGTTNGLQNINAKFGTSLSKTLAIATSSTFNVQFSSNIRAISGTENSGTGLFLLEATGGSQTFTYTFGTITGGAPGEAVTQAGFTILTRNGGVAPTIAVTATFSDATTASGSAAFTTTTTPDQDTFYGFTAPAGRSIASLTVNYGSSGTDLRRGVDDFGFITSVVPEPASAGLLALACGPLLARRRRA